MIYLHIQTKSKNIYSEVIHKHIIYHIYIRFAYTTPRTLYIDYSFRSQDVAQNQTKRHTFHGEPRRIFSQAKPRVPRRELGILEC